jgi:hypothetical protein
MHNANGFTLFAGALIATSVCASFAAADPPEAPPPAESSDDPHRFALGENLLANGDFEQGEGSQPLAWQTVDGLSSFWVEDADPDHGKVMKLDTDVLQTQAYQWWERLLAGSTAEEAPLKALTVEPKYDTLAGLDGVWFWSDPVPVERGKQYWLTVDVKGPGMKVFMRGYPKEPDLAFGADEGALQGYLLKQRGEFRNERGRRLFRHQYVWDSWFPAGGDTQNWRTYSRREKPFSPTKNTPNVKYVRVMLYPYWPPAVYHIDNVRLTEYRAPDAAP